MHFRVSQSRNRDAVIISSQLATILQYHTNCAYANFCSFRLGFNRLKKHANWHNSSSTYVNGEQNTCNNKCMAVMLNNQFKLQIKQFKQSKNVGELREI